MPDTIKDGAGRGYVAEVDSNNDLHTAAVTRSRMAEKSRTDASSYSIYGRRNFTGTGADEGILFFQYDGTKKFYVDTIVASGNGATNKIELFVDSTYGSGGTSVAPINFNRTSANTLQNTSYNGNTDLTVTSGSNEVVDMRFGVDTQILKVDGALILGQSDNLYIKGEVDTIGDRIRVMVLGYEE